MLRTYVFMRILYFSRDYTTHDYRFLLALAKTDHDVGYLRLERGKQQLEDRALPPDIEQIQWAGGHSKVSLMDGPRLLFDLLRVIRRYKPDLIQAGPLQRCAFLVALAGFQPLVSMSWGYDLLVDADRNRWWRWATRFTLKRSATLVGDSEVIRRRAVQHGMIPERIVTFPWGADIRRYAPGADDGLRERLGWDEKTFVILSTRGWAPIYGIEELIRASVLAAQKCPELRVLMLGSGPQSRLIRTIVERAQMIDRVHFPGQVRQAQLPQYYRAADLYVSASHSDGTSISLLEAMACGRPVLVSDIPGNREWVEPNVNGWLFPEGDVNALARAILHAVEARDRLSEMGKVARKLAQQRANWERNFPKLLEAYEIAFQE